MVLVCALHFIPHQPSSLPLDLKYGEGEFPHDCLIDKLVGTLSPPFSQLETHVAASALLPVIRVADHEHRVRQSFSSSRVCADRPDQRLCYRVTNSRHFPHNLSELPDAELLVIAFASLFPFDGCDSSPETLAV